MARPLRFDIPGALCNITTRGNVCEPIYRDDHDREAFVSHSAQLKTEDGLSYAGGPFLWVPLSRVACNPPVLAQPAARRLQMARLPEIIPVVIPVARYVALNIAGGGWLCRRERAIAGYHVVDDNSADSPTNLELSPAEMRAMGEMVVARSVAHLAALHDMPSRGDYTDIEALC
ncbi:MAG: hypothetical protein ABI229_09650, partial [Gemmatimonadaceae bacterium]